jgi:hypothetical protein
LYDSVKTAKRNGFWGLLSEEKEKILSHRTGDF